MHADLINLHCTLFLLTLDAVACYSGRNLKKVDIYESAFLDVPMVHASTHMNSTQNVVVLERDMHQCCSLPWELGNQHRSCCLGALLQGLYSCRAGSVGLSCWGAGIVTCQSLQHVNQPLAMLISYYTAQTLWRSCDKDNTKTTNNSSTFEACHVEPTLNCNSLQVPFHTKSILQCAQRSVAKSWSAEAPMSNNPTHDLVICIAYAIFIQECKMECVADSICKLHMKA